MVNNREKILPIIFTGVHQKPMPRRSCQWLIRKCTLLDVTNNNSQHMTYTLILSCLGDRSTDTQTDRLCSLNGSYGTIYLSKDIIGRCSRKLFVCSLQISRINLYITNREQLMEMCNGHGNLGNCPVRSYLNTPISGAAAT